MQTSKLYWIGIILNLSVYKIHSLTRGRLYVERSDIISGTDISISTDVSETECALSCVENARCRRFGYNRDQKKCYASRDTLNPIAIGGTTFGRYCPHSKGYEELSIGGRKTCIKIETKTMNYTDGLLECVSDGAHLFTLEGPSDVDYIESKGTDVWLWIDGAKTLKTWFGGPLPWINPANMPPPTEGYCIVLNGPLGFMMTFTCHSMLATPICQIDI